ncbi:PREDICTED: uncharacterized protein LOC104707660 [Camelina sativa]|uniref:Uncharacterized protein LOC104707660 n=1 Tax=Camelina sativa TaxID=90675 RepID=A0ABM0T887_CAMSA|nr:PREDICTED: uncharacterized protein LOC104707660 [Camelina sativa]
MFSQGDKIQVTISENLVAQFYVRRRTEEDEWKTISNFALENDTFAVKVVDTNYQIKFTADTVVENIDGLSNNHFIDYHNFDKIYDGWSAFSKNCCLDTMGEVTNVEPIIYVDDPAAPRLAEKSRMKRFSLRNLQGHHLQCVAYNEAADYFTHNFWVADSGKPVVAVLRFWRAKFKDRGEGGMEVVSQPGVSKVLFYPLFPEVQISNSGWSTSTSVRG